MGARFGRAYPMQRVLTPLSPQLPQYLNGGPAKTAEPGPLSWSETVPTGASLAVLWVSADDSAVSGVHTATLGGTAMTLTQSLAAANSSGYYTNLYCFTMFAPPSGSQAFVVTRADNYAITAGTAYYSGVNSLGTPITVKTTATTMSMSATGSNPNLLYAQAFTYLADEGAGISAYSQTQRSPSSLASDPDGYLNPLVFGDAMGNGGTLTFTAHQPSGGYGAGGIIVPLSP